MDPKVSGGNVYVYYDDSFGLTSQDKLQISNFLVALGMDAFFSHSNAVPGTGLALEMDQSLYNMTITIDNLMEYRNQGVEGANIYTSTLPIAYHIYYSPILTVHMLLQCTVVYGIH